MGILTRLGLHKLLDYPVVARRLVKILLILYSKIYTMLGRFASASEGGLHPKHRLMDYHKFFIDNIDKGDSILDVGCGNGALSFDIARKARFVVAIDKEKENIDICKKRYFRENINYVLNDINSYALDKKFNAVILSNTLEHIDNRQGLLIKLGSISNKLLVSTPLINRDWVTLYKRELGLPYMLDKTHKIEYSVEGLMAEIEEAGFKVMKYSIQFGEIWAVAVKREDA